MGFWSGISVAIRDRMRTSFFVFVAACLSCTAAVDSEPPIDRAGFENGPCTSLNGAMLTNLTPGSDVDFMEIRQQGISTQRIGERCAGAADLTACEDAFALLLSPDGWATRPDGGAPAPRAWIAYTRGDEVGAVGRSEIAGFLVPVDSVADAVFLAQIESLGTSECEQSVRETLLGYEVITQTSYSCGGGRDESLVEVLRDGSTRIVERAVLDAGREEICP